MLARLLPPLRLKMVMAFAAVIGGWLPLGASAQWRAASRSPSWRRESSSPIKEKTTTETWRSRDRRLNGRVASSTSGTQPPSRGSYQPRFVNGRSTRSGKDRVTVLRDGLSAYLEIADLTQLAFRATAQGVSLGMIDVMSAEMLARREVGAEPPQMDLTREELAARYPHHPMQQLLQFAQPKYDYLRENVHDFRATLVRQERVQGKLKPQEKMRLKVRVGDAGDASPRAAGEPYAVFLDYLSPRDLEGRRVLYVEGENEGEMIVRKGGRRYPFLKLSMLPDGTLARRESQFPVTEISFNSVIEKLLEMAYGDMAADLDADNTNVLFVDNELFNGRPVTSIVVTHPEHEEGLRYHRASVLVDHALQIPIKLEAYDWPEVPGEEPPLLIDLEYSDVQLNVGLGDEHFTKDALDNPPP